MSTSINIPAILIANGMGITILFVIAIGNMWRIKDTSKDNRFLIIIYFCSLISCIVDPICFIADGKQGLLNRIFVIGGNSILYISGIVLAISWNYFLRIRINVKTNKIMNVFSISLLAGFVALMLVNLFVPVAFTVNESNVYKRELGYYIYTACYGFFILDSLILYFVQKRESGGVKFFPVWAFVIPAGIGITIQTIFYGVSTSAPFITVSIGCIVICIQNEFILRDKLTRLYNRFFLNTLNKKISKSKKQEHAVIMLDINGFKNINDTYGHKIGDEALINLANILVDVVGKKGEVIRYAGDEFIIVYNVKQGANLEDFISSIHTKINDFNSKEQASYDLSISVGYCKANLHENTMDEIIDKVDKLMYEDKEKFYSYHEKSKR